MSDDQDFDEITGEEEPSEDTELPLSKPYLDMIREAQSAFEDWQRRSDNIDKQYASLKTLADTSGDREFQIFWANLEVLRPTIYSRAPQPVVAPRHTDGGELPRKASELLERVLAYDVEDDDLHDTLLQVRDDLALSARGVSWVLDNGRCIHVDREDFVHEPARKWQEVGWVARRAYLTRDAMEERFPEADLRNVKYEKVSSKDGDAKDYKPTAKKAQVWEIWSRAENAVVWVTDGALLVLDMQPPLIDVKGFFPCPRPAYGTLERRTLKPVPDFVYYRDQTDEINELTARISALSESLRLKGFYESGTSEVGEAIEAAFKRTDDKALLVPVSSSAALGGKSLKDAIIWMPVKEVADVITALVALRRQLIEDVYQITGLSDIMRGATDPNETLGAQELKSQYGSIRVRERQAEMVRVARDILRLKAEIYAENVPAAELAQIAQMKLPTQADAAMMLQKAQAQGQQADPSKIVTLEQVDGLLKSQKTRPFVLEVESDSTIAPNEQEEKRSRTEFITAVGGFIQQAGSMVAQRPETAPFAAEMLKFTAGAFRAGRELGGAIDEFAEAIKASAAQAQKAPPPNPEIEKAKAQMQAKQAELQFKVQSKQAESAMAARKSEADLQMAAQKHDLEMQKMQAEILKIQAEIARINAQAAAPRAA